MKKIFILLSGISAIIILSGFAPSINRIDINQGLSNNYIQGIAQDRKGFMWISTHCGLNRFDGNSFKIYKKEEGNLNTVMSNELNRVYSDKFNPIIWIASERSGLSAFNYSTNTFTHYKHIRQRLYGLIADGITCMDNDTKGNLWIATYLGGVDYLNSKTQGFTHYNTKNVKGLVSDFNWCVKDDQHGKLYIGHVSSGLSILDPIKRTAVNYSHIPDDPNSIPGTAVSTILIDSKRRVWIGTNNGLALFNPTTQKFTSFRLKTGGPGSHSNNRVLSLYESTDHTLWIGTDGDGVYLLDQKLNQAINYKKLTFTNLQATSQSNATISILTQDQFGNMWIGTQGRGINVIPSKSKYFQSIRPSTTGDKNRINNPIVSNLCMDSNGHLWTSTDIGIDVFKGRDEINIYDKLNNSIKDGKIISIIKDYKSNIYIGSYNGGVWYYNIQKDQLNEIKELKLRNTVKLRCLFIDSKQKLWIGTNFGIRVYNPETKQIITYNKDNSLIRDNVMRSISEDSLGNIWVGTLGGGLSIFNSQFKLLRHWRANRFYEVNCIYKDHKGQMWVGTRENLYLFRRCTDASFIEFGLENGLKDNYIRAITEGFNDQFWISTNSGISCLDLKSGRIQNFNEHDGVPLGNFMSGAVAKAQDGTIYFGSESGICYFNPRLPLYAYKTPPVVITELGVIDRNNIHTGSLTDIPLSSNKVKLNYNQSTINISFNVLDYSLNDAVEFSYQLKGMDNAWYNIQNEKQLVFRNLRPGKYEFSIKTRMRHQEWSDNITKLEIVIYPPFWLSWWAKTIYGLIILIIIYYIIRFYKNKVNLQNSLYYEKKNLQRVQELNEERLRFYTNITHELRTPLTLIIGPLEDIVTDQTVQPQLSRKIHAIYNSANRLLGLINQILEFRKAETGNKELQIINGDLSTTISEIGLKYKELKHNNEVEIIVQVPDIPICLYFDPEVICIILDNLMTNALKYTSTGHIHLQLLYVEEEELIEIIVRDTGYGISAEALPRIFDSYYQEKGKHQMSGTGIGLSLVKSMVELHQGTIKVKSQLGQGTEFIVSLSASNTYPDSAHRDLPEPHKAEGSPNKIMLIVEDNREIREYIRESFLDSFEIHTAVNGQEGFQKAIEFSPDIIISDVMMPVMDGFEFCKMLKEDIRTSHIPIILLTAKDSIQDKTEGYSVGADSYITKPFSARLLEIRINNLFDIRKKMYNLYTNPVVQKHDTLKESLSKLDKEFMDKLTSFIEENLESENINVDLLADQMFMSKSTLYRKLKALTGLSTNEYIRKMRINTAEKLLITGKYKISEIVYMVGFNSINYFRECFKEEYGVTPREYMDKIKSGS